MYTSYLNITGWTRKISNLKKIVLWMCQDLPARRINTDDHLKYVSTWLKKFDTNTRKVEGGKYDARKLTFSYVKLVNVQHDFDVMDTVHIQWNY